MILARITQAIRTQNWFAVVLEFVIVIAGVVIGFQVSELAATARDTAEEARALGRLRLESEAVVEFWTEDVETAINRDRERIMLLRALETGLIPEGEEAAVYSGIERLYFYAALNPPRTVFDELLASGGLGRISDSDARAAVSEYADTLSFITGQLLQLRTSVPDGMAAIEGHVFSRYDPSSATLQAGQRTLEATRNHLNEMREDSE
jgi:hypothetical protein